MNYCRILLVFYDYSFNVKIEMFDECMNFFLILYELVDMLLK